MVASPMVNDDLCTHYLVLLDQDHSTVSHFLQLKSMLLHIVFRASAFAFEINPLCFGSSLEVVADVFPSTKFIIFVK